jgi:uncharacterized protein (DUF58 family)
LTGSRWLAGLRRRNLCDEHGVATIGARRIYILPTSLGAGFGAMLMATLLGSLNYQNNLGLFLTFLMAAIALVSMHHCWYNLLGLSLRAANAPPVFCGQPARFRIELWSRRGRAHGEVCVRGGGCTALENAGAHREIELSVQTQRRGPMPLAEILIDTQHPLGLFRAWAWAQTSASALVYPTPAERAPPPPAMPARRPNASGRQTDQGADDFIGPRAYRPGDSPRRLDWKALARERGLVTKAFGADEASRVRLDLAQPAGDLEQRLSVLARQALNAEAQQLEYGLRLGNLELPCGSGAAHQQRCLEALARYPREPSPTDQTQK